MHHAGFAVRIFDRVRQFQRLGDSLGLGENALLLLDRWVPALRARLVGIGNKSPLMQIRRWQDGKVLVQQELMDMAGFIGHRGDYHEEFLRAVREEGVEITMGKTVRVFVLGEKWTAVLGTVWDGIAEASGRLSSMTSSGRQ
ncbi:hypothetical protein MMC18_006622 [Xylographa bjoerkii]|nr:hypothetical protein [Xylographa bjoerkii]